MSLLNSWSAVDWFVQSVPRIAYRWNGYNRPLHTTYSETPRISFRAEFHPPADNFVPLPSVDHPDWHVLTEPSPYEAILWRYMTRVKNINGDSEYEIFSSNEVTVNGIRVQRVSQYDQSGKIALSKEDIEGGPMYALQRPSTAIFDPAGICPINLQRSSVSFDRMGIDTNMAKAVLREHLKQFKRLGLTCDTLGNFAKLCNAITKQPGVQYQSQVGPICVTSSGLFLASPTLFIERKVHTLFFIDTAVSPSSPLLTNLLQEGEALMLRQKQSGTQADLAWFRSIFSGDGSSTYSYARTAGLPCLRQSTQISAMLTKKWKFANEKGKVNRDILRSLQNTALKKAHTLVRSGLDEEINILIPRIEAILGSLSSNSEVAAWKLDEHQPYENNRPMLHDLWVEIFDDLIPSPVPSFSTSVH